MYLQLKTGETFINPETGEPYNELTGGVTLIKTETRQKRTGLLLEFHEIRERMIEGKAPEFKLSVTMEDTEEITDFTDNYMKITTGQPLGIETENAMYDFILSQPRFEVFEKIN